MIIWRDGAHPTFQRATARVGN